MTGEIEEILEDVLRRITPEKKERDKIRVLSEKLERKVASASGELGVKVKVRVEGSVAKDTWIGEEPDIDIFMRVAKTIPRKSLGDVCLRIARKATAGSKQIERFAEHPYLEAVVDGTRVNIVPCYEVKQGEWLSATDRTPFHTDYMKKHLNVQMQAEVRLLKKFMKGIGVYGAEIKIGGFSGYLCELLILHYKSFMDTLKAFAQYRQRMVIDIEGFFKSRQKEIDLLFDEPLVVVDPVDKARNVASAVRVQRLYTLVAAAQVFLKKPRFNFFYPPKTAPLTVGKMRHELKKRGSAIVFVTFGKVDAVPDILWGQLYKSQRSLRKLVELSDFKFLRDLPWSDEKGLNIFVFELEHYCVSPVKMHLGPPLEKEKECERFNAKHQGKRGTVSGPYVEDGRWVVLVQRKFTDACMLLREKLKDGGRNAGVAEQISQMLKKGFKVLVNEEIIDVYKKSKEFAVFLTEFLLGKPKWLEAAER
jgi:tRNA nucleotidyltransferase (CCA-adding enzyme)